MKKIVFLVLACAAAFVSCKKEDIPQFNSSVATLDFLKSYYIPNYNRPDYDTLVLNSVFYIAQAAENPEIDFKLPMRMSGAIVDYDRSFKIRVVPEKSRGDLVEGVHYTLPEQVFHAGQYADSAIVRVNIDKLRADKAEGTLVIEHVPGENFGVGLESYQSIGLKISGKGFATQPDFWNANDLTEYGGTYSSIKAEKFVELSGLTSDSLEPIDQAELYAYCKLTYEWFRDNPTYDEDGQRVEFKGSVIYE